VPQAGSHCQRSSGPGRQVHFGQKISKSSFIGLPER
jgi:hypothetical protein